MGYGDAYKYAIGIKPCNVDRLQELLIEYKDMQSILSEELEVKTISNSSRFIFNMLPYHQEQINKLIWDNTWMIYLTADDCHDQYDKCDSYSYCLIKVKDLFEDIFPKSEYSHYWETGEFLNHLDEWAFVAHSHYDCHEEWMECFAVKEVKNV